jgi:hypothetical protein
MRYFHPSSFYSLDHWLVTFYLSNRDWTAATTNFPSIFDQARTAATPFPSFQIVVLPAFDLIFSRVGSTAASGFSSVPLLLFIAARLILFTACCFYAAGS